MLHWFRKMKSEKGQGLVEFALILAFCAVIAFAVSKSGFKEAISALLDSGNHYEYETAAIGGSNRVGGGPGGGGGGSESGVSEPGGGPGVSEPGGGPGASEPGGGPGGVGWKSADPTSYYEDAATQAERLARDQGALINIAKHFIGLTQKEVKYLLNNKTADMASDQEIVLGHFVPSEGNKGMKFQADGALIAAQSQNIFAWMQGYNTELDMSAKKNIVVENHNYDKDSMYLYSDYVVSQSWAAEAGTAEKNGLYIRLEYDYIDHNDPDPNGTFKSDDVRVVGVQLALDPKSQHNDVLGLEKSGGKYNDKDSKGLEVQVRLDGKNEYGQDKYLITGNDTGVKIATSEDYTGKVTSNWYGDCTIDAVKAYIRNNREDMTGRTLNFTRGEIYRFKQKGQQGEKYYVVVKDAENVTIKDSYKQVPDLEFDKYNAQTGPQDSNIFVKSTDKDDRYYRENGYKDWDANNHCYKRKAIKEHGTLIVKGTGEVYMYVGTGTDVPYDDLDIINDNDTDYVLIRGKRENDDSIGRY